MRGKTTRLGTHTLPIFKAFESPIHVLTVNNVTGDHCGYEILYCSFIAGLVREKLLLSSINEYVI